jgi:hypothetical protein
MISKRLVLPVVCAAVLLALPTAASAYTKPPGGKWNIQDSFERTKGGAMKLSADGSKLTKLVLNAGDDYVEDCGATVRLASTPTIKKFPTAGSRYAFGRQKKGSSLIVPIGVSLEVKGKTVKGTLVMLFDEGGKLATTAEVEAGDCDLDFHARKAR